MPDAVLVDHVNGDQLDNRRWNLRATDRSGNSRNACKWKNRKTTSKYKGVSWSKAMRCWRSDIVIKGKSHQIGCHRTQKEAALAYDAKATAVFGEYARLNFPPPMCWLEWRVGTVVMVTRTGFSWEWKPTAADKLATSWKVAA